jgi:hypothetical protein
MIQKGVGKRGTGVDAEEGNVMKEKTLEQKIERYIRDSEDNLDSTSNPVDIVPS